jgi:hypothetical protein
LPLLVHFNAAPGPGGAPESPLLLLELLPLELPELLLLLVLPELLVVPELPPLEPPELLDMPASLPGLLPLLLHAGAAAAHAEIVANKVNAKWSCRFMSLLPCGVLGAPKERPAIAHLRPAAWRRFHPIVGFLDRAFLLGAARSHLVARRGLCLAEPHVGQRLAQSVQRARTPRLHGVE